MAAFNKFRPCSRVLSSRVFREVPVIYAHPFSDASTSELWKSSESFFFANNIQYSAFMEHRDRVKLDLIQNLNPIQSGFITSKTLHPTIVDTYTKCFKEATFSGKRYRAAMFLALYNEITTDKSLETMARIYRVAWCLELLHFIYCAIDDIIDKSSTRRGLPCWYISAHDRVTVDVSYMLHMITNIFVNCVRSYENVHEIIAFVSKVHSAQLYAQSLERAIAMEGAERNFENYTLDNMLLTKIGHTAYYTFRLPYTLALYLAGKATPKNIRIVENITDQSSIMLSFSDDYLDVYGIGAETLGKQKHVDIKAGTLSGLFLKAMELANSEQKRTILENYGINSTENVQRVVNVYNNLNLREICENEFRKRVATVKENVDRNCQLNNELPSFVFHDFIDKYLVLKK